MGLTRRFLGIGDEITVNHDGHDLAARITGTQGNPDTFRAEVTDPADTTTVHDLAAIGVERNTDGWFTLEPAYYLRWGDGNVFVLPETDARTQANRWRNRGSITGDLDRLGGIIFNDNFGRRATLTRIA